MHVWAKGDKCLAPYSEDGENEDYFDARIEKIMKLPGTSRTVAFVTFVGYEADGQEAFDISKLKKKESEQHSRKLQDNGENSLPEDQAGHLSQNIKLFSPDQEKQRICMLYDDSDEEESVENSRVNNYVFDSSSSAKESPTKKPKSKKGLTPAKSEASTEPAQKIAKKDSDDTAATSEFSGFTDDDLERPKFRHVRGGEKVPAVLSPPDVTPVVQVPATINQYLRDYQRDGIKFLYDKFVRGKGAILADDMGLGKTVQVIGFIAAILGRTGTKTDVMSQVPKFIRRLSDPNVSLEEDQHRKIFLIVGPASVLYNWVDEFETWGYFTVGKFHQSHKDETVADLKKHKLDVVVTTFETCRDNLDIINEFPWTAVIADEAHKIKGHKSEITVALKRLRCKRRYGLSGTVLQNNMKELWCVLDWANPKCLGTLPQFEAKYVWVIAQGQKRDASKRELAMARKAKEEFGKLRAQWMLRRTKALIADQLPTKEQKVIYCQPTSFQVSVYKAILGHKLMKAVLTQHHPCQCNSGRTSGKCCSQIVVDDEGREYPVKSVTMTFMHLLMKVSNHVALLLPCHTDSPEQQIRAREICNVAFLEHPQFLQQTKRASFRTLSDPKYCGKMKVLCGLLSVFKKEGSKVLIFSLSTRLLDILEQYIISKGYEYRRLDGKTPNIRRTQLVREFNKDRGIFLFIASTKAGGIGLNLTGANVVMIFDPNWNPSHDLQAEDRAYRIGQGRDVRVFRLISSGTIEEIVYLRQIYKQQLDKVVVADENARRLFHGVAGDSKNKGELFGISNLFTLREGGSTLTADIFKRNEQTEAGLKGFNVVDYIAPETDTEETKEKTVVEEQKATTDDGGTPDMYGADALMAAIFDSDDESNEKPSPKKKKRDLLDSVSEDEDQSPQPSTSKSENTSQTRKRRLPKSFQRNSDSADKIGNLFDSDDESKRKPSPKKKNRDLMDSVSEDEDQRPQPSTSKSENSSQTRKRRLPKSFLRNSDSTDKIGKLFDSDDESKQKPSPKKKKRDLLDSKERSGKPLPLVRAASLNQSFDSASQVFENCGVVHTHDNRRILGRSSAEDYMSRCAIQEVYELHQNSQEPAIHCDPVSSGDESDDFGAALEYVKKKPEQKRSERKPEKDDAVISKSIQNGDKHKSPKRPTDKKTSEKKRPPMQSRSPIKRFAVTEGCQFISQSSDEDASVRDDDKMNGKIDADKIGGEKTNKSMTDLKLKNRSTPDDAVKLGLQLHDTPPSHAKDDDILLGNTQSIIDKLLGMNDSDTGKKRLKSKAVPQKTAAKPPPKKKPEKKEESQENTDSGSLKDTMALLDELFD